MFGGLCSVPTCVSVCMHAFHHSYLPTFSSVSMCVCVCLHLPTLCTDVAVYASQETEYFFVSH